MVYTCLFPDQRLTGHGRIDTVNLIRRDGSSFYVNTTRRLLYYPAVTPGVP